MTGRRGEFGPASPLSVQTEMPRVQAENLVQMAYCHRCVVVAICFDFIARRAPYSCVLEAINITQTYREFHDAERLSAVLCK